MGGDVSMEALERLLGIVLDQSLKPDAANWARAQVAVVFKLAMGRAPKPKPCECSTKTPDRTRKRASTRPGW